MGNRFRDIFNPDSDYNKELKEKAEKIKQQLIADKHCSYCANSHEEPHYEMGYYGGTDTYCDVYHKLMLSYPTGQECLFWKLKEDKDNDND